MTAHLAEYAMHYHSEGLCVIPIKPRDKAPALNTWEEYQQRLSTEDEIRQWWSANPNFNVGLVHGLNGYIAIDIDHDAGALDEIGRRFPRLTSGRIEQSGSGQGYHIPLLLRNFPYLGHDAKKNRPKGNRTWHTRWGEINLRARYCQTVVPPSIHPSGNPYRFLQTAAIVRAFDISDVVEWLNAECPQDRPEPRRRISPPNGNGSTRTVDTLKAKYPSLLNVFTHLLGASGEIEEQTNGEYRLKGHGGLLVNEADGEWYNFSDETGGDVIDAWGWCRYRQQWDRHDKLKFQSVLREMEKS